MPALFEMPIAATWGRRQILAVLPCAQQHRDRSLADAIHDQIVANPHNIHDQRIKLSYDHTALSLPIKRQQSTSGVHLFR